MTHSADPVLMLVLFIVGALLLFRVLPLLLLLTIGLLFLAQMFPYDQGVQALAQIAVPLLPSLIVLYGIRMMFRGARMPRRS